MWHDVLPEMEHTTKREKEMCVELAGDVLPKRRQKGHSNFENIVISGGTNGNIMIWRIPSKKDVESATTDSQNNY